MCLTRQTASSIISKRFLCRWLKWPNGRQESLRINCDHRLPLTLRGVYDFNTLRQRSASSSYIWQNGSKLSQGRMCCILFRFLEIWRVNEYSNRKIASRQPISTAFMVIDWIMNRDEYFCNDPRDDIQTTVEKRQNVICMQTYVWHAIHVFRKQK